MKIKILLFPLIILVSFYLSVAHIFPDWQKTGEVKAEIKGNQEIIKNLETQQANVNALSAQISADAQHQDDLIRIVQRFRSEETIINDAHALARDHDVVLLEMRFGDAQKKSTKRSGDVFTDTPVYVKEGNAQIGVSITGSYKNTKIFLDNFGRIIRANTPAELSIARGAVSGEGEEASPLEDRLDTEATFEYPYMETILLDESDMASLNHAIQKTDHFDVSPIDQWLSNHTNDSNLILGEHGRSTSPFLPQ